MDIIAPIKEFLGKNITISIIFGIILTAIIGRYILNPIFQKLEDYLRHPKIIINLVKLSPMESGASLKNFFLLFSTVDNQGILLAAQIENRNLDKEYGFTPIPINLLADENKNQYIFSLKNTSKHIAKNINLDIMSPDEIYINKDDVDPKISNINCGGIGENKGCRVKIDSMDAGESIYFVIVTNEINSIKTTINNYDENIYINQRNYFMFNLPIDSKLGFKQEGGEEIILEMPPINESSNPIQYHYGAIENKWIKDF